MNPKKILIIKLSSLGDVIMTIPVADLIKKTHPGVKLGWVTEEGGLEALEDYDALHKLYLFEKKKSKRGPGKGIILKSSLIYAALHGRSGKRDGSSPSIFNPFSAPP